MKHVEIATCYKISSILTEFLGSCFLSLKMFSMLHSMELNSPFQTKLAHVLGSAQLALVPKLWLDIDQVTTHYVLIFFGFTH